MTNQNGRFEVRLNHDHTQALVTIYPPQGDGKDASFEEILERLHRMNAGHSSRPEEIQAGISQARTAALPTEVVGAQGVLPKDGQDAKVRYFLSEEVIRQHPPKHFTFPETTDWFALDARQLVKKGQEVASTIPAQPGVLGKTCTLPIRDVPYRPSKPAYLSLGKNVAHSADSLHVHATTDGYCYLHGERLTVAGFQQFPEEVVGGYHTFEQGVIFFDAITDAEIVAEEFIAVQGEVKNCTLRSKGDILLQNAENCIIVTAGTVYVDGDLINCDIKTRQKVVGSPYSRIMGGTVRAFREITAGSVGTSDFIETTLEVGNDHYTPLRDIEIEQEMVGCNYNILRIQSALKPFSSSAAHRNLTDERRALIQQIQSHQKVQEDRIRLLREEKRRNVLLTKERVTATITVVETHPGVWIRNGRLQLLVETPMQHVQFVEAQRGTTLLAVPLENAT